MARGMGRKQGDRGGGDDRMGGVGNFFRENFVDQWLLEKLVCPITHSKLRVEGEFLVSEAGGLRYPVKDGLPVLLPDAAQLPEGVKSVEEARERFGKGAVKG